MSSNFYVRNDYVISSTVNVLFEDLLNKTPIEFEQWVKEMRKEILYAWDTFGCPPRTGKSEADVIDQFNKKWTYFNPKRPILFDSLNRLLIDV